MRCTGLVAAPCGLGPHGHACWAYDDPADLSATANEFLAEGAELGQRLMFVGGPEAEAVMRDTEPMRSMVRTGQLDIARFDDMYPGGGQDSDAQRLAVYRLATEKALADGFTGLRVVADLTALATMPGGWLALARWESVIDGYMATRPMSALCCFDRRTLSDDDALAGIASVHPVVDRRLQPLVAFQLYAEPDALALSGDVDTFCADRLDQLLGQMLGGAGGAKVVLDLEGLRFIDHTGVLTIRRHAQRLLERSGALVLRSESDAFRRLSDLLGWTDRHGNSEGAC